GRARRRGGRGAGAWAPSRRGGRWLACVGRAGSGWVGEALVVDEPQRQARVLRFWRALELFNAQPVDPVDEARQRFRVQSGRPLPWEYGHPLRNRRLGEGKVWRHTVYGGVYALDRVHEVLERVFGSSGEAFDERVARGG